MRRARALTASGATQAGARAKGGATRTSAAIVDLQLSLIDLGIDLRFAPEGSGHNGRFAVAGAGGRALFVPVNITTTLLLMDGGAVFQLLRVWETVPLDVAIILLIRCELDKSFKVAFVPPQLRVIMRSISKTVRYGPPAASALRFASSTDAKQMAAFAEDVTAYVAASNPKSAPALTVDALSTVIRGPGQLIETLGMSFIYAAASKCASATLRTNLRFLRYVSADFLWEQLVKEVLAWVTSFAAPTQAKISLGPLPRGNETDKHVAYTSKGVAVLLCMSVQTGEVRARASALKKASGECVLRWGKGEFPLCPSVEKADFRGVLGIHRKDLKAEFLRLQEFFSERTAHWLAACAAVAAKEAKVAAAAAQA